MSGPESDVGEFTPTQISPEVGRAVEERLRAWQAAGAGRAVWSKDPRFWPRAAADSVRTRLGWLDLPTSMGRELPEYEALAAEAHEDGFAEAVLLGMGGSSLAPQVFAATFAPRAASLHLRVLDSTHPGAVGAMRAAIDLDHTLFVVSSKSGTTLEPNSFLAYFWDLVAKTSPHPERQFVAITDPGTALARLAEDRTFRRCFLADPNVGGRYSALSAFGLLPAALVGVDLAKLLGSARAMADACGPEVPVDENPGFRLGALLGELATAGRDNVTLVTTPTFAAFPAWAEQLIAESTGKSGTGIVPVAGEVGLDESPARSDLVLASLELQSESAADGTTGTSGIGSEGAPRLRTRVADPVDLGAELFRWEFAVAAAGAVLGIDPFDQPDVEIAKDLARQAMARPAGRAPDAYGVSVADDPVPLRDALRSWAKAARPGCYVAIQAYLRPDEPNEEALGGVRLGLHAWLGLATTLGFGPRFLHSTGQLHKGGPPSGLFLQIVDSPREDIAVPGAKYTFGEIIRAQAKGDATVLTQRGRPILTVNVGAEPLVGLGRLGEAVAGAGDPSP
jgi:transaldolase/glucose-6-phosphate isomerase